MPQQTSKQVAEPALAPAIEDKIVRNNQDITEGALDGATEQGHQEEEEEVETEDAVTVTTESGTADGTAAVKKKKPRKKKPKESTSSAVDTASTSSPSMQPSSSTTVTTNGSSTASQTQSPDIVELLRDLATSGVGKLKKAPKEMSSYKFWQTQPVPRFDDPVEGSSNGSKERSSDAGEVTLSKVEAKDVAQESAQDTGKAVPPTEDKFEGPIQEVDIDKVSKKPIKLIDGFEWVELDLEDAKELEEVYDLLSNHYVEDDESMFRFNYSTAFFRWALKAPGWRREWHVGVRAATSRKLVAFISGIPISLRVREHVLQTSEINFLCIHKKLRAKRLAPVLIREITRRCNLVGIFQAIYTAGVVLPTPVSTCRYFHRALDWEKLHAVGFSPLPPNSTPLRQKLKYKLPDTTGTPNLRPMEAADVPAVLDLLKRYLKRVDLAQEFTEEELVHWLLDKQIGSKDQVVWSYVVEKEKGKGITDFFSFYCLESTVIQGGKHSIIRAAYLFYYATDAAFEKQDNDSALKARLNALIKDALILAKKARFDVFNALTLLDNPLFLTQQLFGPGDGQLHYYLYNWRTPKIAGGIDERNEVSEAKRGGVGVVML
ncbi:glycylpeptide N-tetradecanoyltransferase [Elasticomyces elasticus]|nr:glycylpeptide N-tetradecanoyltransferase [Elasticomyces elasticus]